MSISTPDLQRFLADLTSRRERLALVAGTADDQLAQELEELGERLVIADEELRVQAEELEEVQRRLAEGALERAVLASAAPELITTAEGVLLTANVAAYRLADQPRARRRPVVFWFAVDDRAAVRSLVSATAGGRRVPRRTVLRLRRADGDLVPVEAEVDRVVTASGDVALRWRLVAVDATDPQAAAPAPPVSDLLADDLASLALELAERDTVTAVLAGVVDAAVGLVPGTDEAVLTLLRRAEHELSEATSTATAELQAWQLVHRSGPAYDVAVAGPGAVVTSPDVAADPRWPGVPPVGLDVGQRAVVSVCVRLPTVNRNAVLSCYGAVGAGLDVEASRTALLVAAHASLALDRSLTEANLRAAMETRQSIGQAVGILVEREKVHPEEAFARLVSRSQHANRRLREVARLVVETAVSRQSS
jgi:PAS domain-containing protein